MKTKKPQFASFACVGDSIRWGKSGFDFTATLEADIDSSPLDYECYSPIKIKQWKNDGWFYVGVVISVSLNGIELLDHAASLWSCECNYNAKSNRHLADVAFEMESAALEAAQLRRVSMMEKLGVTQ